MCAKRCFARTCRRAVSPRRWATKTGGPTDRAERLVEAIRRCSIKAIKAGGSSLRDHRQTSGELGYFQHSFRGLRPRGRKMPDADMQGHGEAFYAERTLDVLVSGLSEVVWFGQPTPPAGETIYFRTQMMRTTAAFASNDPLAGVTLFAFRNACTASTGASRPARRASIEAPQRSPASTAQGLRIFRSYRARRRRKNPSAGAGDSAGFAAAADLRNRCLDAAHGRAAALILRIGNADEFEADFGRAAIERDRLQSVRAVDAQQREAVILVVGDAIGVAVAGDDDRLGSRRRRRDR